MRHQAIGKLALMLGVLFAGAASAQASPVRYNDVVALASVAGQSGRPSVDLRVRAQQQGQQTAGAAQQTASAKAGSPAQEQKQVAAPDTSVAPATSPASLTGTEVAPQQPAQQTNIETVELGEVQGTICDCGPIRIPGGFPKWPWLALGAVPFFFIHGCDNEPCETETPTPTPPSVPEPATIFLLGTGLAALGARARRSYARRTVACNDEVHYEATGEV